MVTAHWQAGPLCGACARVHHACMGVCSPNVHGPLGTGRVHKASRSERIPFMRATRVLLLAAPRAGIREPCSGDKQAPSFPLKEASQRRHVGDRREISRAGCACTSIRLRSETSPLEKGGASHSGHRPRPRRQAFSRSRPPPPAGLTRHGAGSRHKAGLAPHAGSPEGALDTPADGPPRSLSPGSDPDSTGAPATGPTQRPTKPVSATPSRHGRGERAGLRDLRSSRTSQEQPSRPPTRPVLRAVRLTPFRLGGRAGPGMASSL